MLSKFNIRGI